VYKFITFPKSPLPERNTSDIFWEYKSAWFMLIVSSLIKCDFTNNCKTTAVAIIKKNMDKISSIRNSPDLEE
jgi:hypothetical protein